MAVTKYAEEDIIPIVLHILSFSTVKFAEYGYKAVIENEMPSLIVLEDDDVTPIMYFEILEASEDEISVAITKCIDKIDETINTFCIMYAIDLEEMFADERIHELASQIYSDLYYYADGIIEDSVSMAVMELPFTAANAFFFLCRLVLHGEIDAESSMDEGFYGTGWEEFEFLDTSENTVAIIHDLVSEILKMNIEIYDIYMKKDSEQRGLTNFE
jgi:hypothetical protein